ncbi:MAG: hypothetical protein NTW94_08195 [Legionellales bacterium]|nr:hypothetical protein [Legionellales bacterium]
MARVYYWHDLMGDFERFAPYRSTLLKLLQGEYDALSLEKLRTPSRHPIFSIRINRSDRILFTTCAGKAYLLDVVLGHHYEDSSFLQRGVLNAFLSTKETCAFEPMGEEKLLIDAAPVDDVLDPIPLVYFQRQFIELNTNQQAAIQATLPTVVSGPAGSGKTCIALSMLVSYVREHRDHPSPPMYICQSNHLCRLMQESWNEIAHERGFRTDVLFITYKSMLLARGLTLADENDFKTWLDALSPKSHDLIRSLKANDLWREFRIRSGYSDEEYTHLGQRRSLISRPEDRRTLCALYSRYLQHLKAKHIFSADLCPLDVDIAYPLVVVDEAQDFSYEQLQSLNQLARGQIAYLLGEHQILFDGKSRLIYLKDMLHKAKLRTCIVHLPASYRCPQRVLDIANALVELKNQCTGGAVDKGESQEMCVSPELLGTTGNATWLHPDDKEAIERLRGTSMHNAQFAVVTDHEHLEQAREQFETSVIFTPSQIKGLEYNTVVLYKLFDSAYFQAAGKKLHTKSTETVPRHRAKSGEADESFLVPFNEAITATTRAKMDL